MKKIFIFLIIFFAKPVFADIRISEIFYDAEGSDEGLEWVEIYNAGEEFVDITQWHFFENDVHHGIGPDVYSELAPGEYALLVKDPSLSLVSSSIKQFKSSFSLNNTGEDLAISDPDKNIIFEVSYNKDNGAAGNGLSLHVGDSGDISEAKISPGSGDLLNSSSSSDSSSKADSNNFKDKKDASFQPYYTMNVNIEGSFLAGSLLEISFPVLYFKSRSHSVGKLKGYWRVNFGDGKFEDFSEKKIFYYRYAYPGDYIISAKYYSSDLAYKNDKVLAETELKVSLADQYDLSLFYYRGGVSIKNSSSERIWLRGWVLRQDGNEFIFSDASYINPHSELRLPPNRTGFAPDYLKSTILLSDAGSFIAMSDYSVNTVSINRNQKVSTSTQKDEDSFDRDELFGASVEINQEKDTPVNFEYSLNEGDSSEVKEEEDKKSSYLVLVFGALSSAIAAFFLYRFGVGSSGFHEGADEDDLKIELIE